MGLILNAKFSIGILTSSEDAASQNIKKKLLETFEFKIVEKTFDSFPILQRIYSFHSIQPLNVNTIEPNLRLPKEIITKMPLISEYFVNPFVFEQPDAETIRIDRNSKNKVFETDTEITLTIEILSTDQNKIFLDSTLKEAEIQKLNEDYDFLIAASRHKSEAGKPALLVHSPGNFSTAEAGGKDQSLSISSSVMQHLLFRNLETFKEIEKFDFPVDLEVTHHGPTEINTPLTFIELGSSEEEYNNPIGGTIIAKSIIAATITLASRPKTSTFGLVIGIGFGGMHYAGNFSRKLENGFAFSHLVSKYNLEHINEEIIEKMIKRTLEKVDMVVLDWKSMKSQERQTLLKILEKSNLPILRTQNL